MPNDRTRPVSGIVRFEDVLRDQGCPVLRHATADPLPVVQPLDALCRSLGNAGRGVEAKAVLGGNGQVVEERLAAEVVKDAAAQRPHHLLRPVARQQIAGGGREQLEAGAAPFGGFLDALGLGHVLRDHRHAAREGDGPPLHPAAPIGKELRPFPRPPRLGRLDVLAAGRDTGHVGKHLPQDAAQQLLLGMAGQLLCRVVEVGVTPLLVVHHERVRQAVEHLVQ